MKAIYNKLNILIPVFLLVFQSCDKYLDRAPELPLDDNAVFTVFSNAERYHNDIYANLQQRFNAVGNYQPVPMASASDESDSPMGYHGTQVFNAGSYDGADADLGNYYNGIRKANTFLSKVPIIPFPNDAKKQQMMGEAWFLRAFYFNEVIKRFGGMPVMDENNILLPGQNMSFPRNTYKECVTFILDDLEKAIANLPVTLTETEYGRATKGAAMALKARVLLFAASPLWQKEMEQDLWIEAAEAAKAVIDLTDENGDKVYELYTTGSNADDYEQLFFKRREHGNKEVIYYKHASPVGFSSSEIKVWAPKGGDLGGDGAVCPTQNFVDLFEMADGSLFDWNNPIHAANPYQNRDPRFYKTVLYNGAAWQGETMELFYNPDKDLSGKHRKDKSDYTRTGYYVRKYLPEGVQNLTQVTAYHNWIYFRLAEMYLNYAEALNEVAGPDDANGYGLTARDAVNTVRGRSGMPNIIASDKAQMRERLWNERAIELSFEEHRWWDARRWQKAVDWFGGAMYEMEITKEGSNLTYTKKPFYNRVYRPYMDLYPIPSSELRKNSQYYQNPGW